MKPKPWSHSALEDFKNCPRAFHEKRVLKSVVETKGEATIWGEQVHKHFEERLVDGVVLPPALEMHEEFLAGLEALPGEQFVEQRIALNTGGQPCEFFADDVWFRGVIDYKKVNGDHARVIDHKTGKYHQKLGQLFAFMLHTFAQHPEVQRVTAEYYWTQTKTCVGVTYGRERIPELWKMFIADLRQYAEAFKTDTWQPRQSGLCNGWCPVTSCEFWKPKRGRI
jgi:hypothetical protein